MAWGRTLAQNRPDSAGFRSQRRLLLLVFVLATGLTAMAPLATAVTNGRVQAMDLLSDPAELTGAAWYLGALSTINVLAWTAGAVIFLVVAAGTRERDPSLSAAMCWLGVLTAALAVDDQFLLHEISVPWLFGVTEVVTFGVYAAVLAGILFRYRRVLLRQPEVALLTFALVAFAGSLLLDVLGWDTVERRVVEEGLKLFGTLAWAALPASIAVRWLSTTPK